jgi:hypothetical protein
MAVFEQVMVDPLIEEESPTLYLVDTQMGRVERLAEVGFLPSFSPDGRRLAYVTSDEGDVGYAAIYDLETFETVRAPGSLGASTCFWADEGKLGLVFELEDGYRVAVADLTSGEVVELI